MQNHSLHGPRTNYNLRADRVGYKVKRCFDVQPPEQPARWTEPFIANTMGPACIQDEGAALAWNVRAAAVSYSEDCLNVNVYAPNVYSTIVLEFHLPHRATLTNFQAFY